VPGAPGGSCRPIAQSVTVALIEPTVGMKWMQPTRTRLPVGGLGDGADEGAAEELNDGERAAAARGREDEAGVFPQVRFPP
jgi:hypothetical protein